MQRKSKSPLGATVLPSSLSHLSLQNDFSSEGRDPEPVKTVVMLTKTSAGRDEDLKENGPSTEMCLLHKDYKIW